MATVFSLIASRYPDAIVGCVVAVDVDTFDRIAGRSTAHVGQEVFEFIPAFADFDAAPTVVFVAFIFWVAAAVAHGDPSFIFARSLIASGFSVLNVAPAVGEHLAFDAPAGQDGSGAQMAAINDGVATAVTLAKPTHAVATFLRGYGSETAKTAACDINVSGHRDLLSRLRVKWQPWRYQRPAAAPF